MRTLTYFVAATIDGFIAESSGTDPTDSLFGVEGDHMAAISAEYPEIIPGHVRTALGIAPDNVRFDTLLEGRHSYEIGLQAGITNAYPHLRHYLFSTSMAESPDPTVELVRDDAVETVRRLKREDGDGIWLCGGGRLAWSLRTEIDELIVKVNPVVTGSGVPLFAGGFDAMRFRLERSRTFDSGVVFLTYTRS
ncbi:dihydrofolate reductase [Haloactinopolyspora alba]|uniref:Dihydrofolate reductase n=1 Tax=Haloactinopolyspora alba TaxID=648780 RepID=A0A2P8DEE0_9ACTN|nr:dihydrofolate reductase family protein [Haloactinopolyspora alba]PSK95565.1 dihydrofolate reductase [Haloactinopolyspora alba]